MFLIKKSFSVREKSHRWAPVFLGCHVRELLIPDFTFIKDKIRTNLSARNVAVSCSAERFALTRFISVASWRKDGGVILERLENRFYGKVKFIIITLTFSSCSFPFLVRFWSSAGVLPSLIYIYIITNAGDQGKRNVGIPARQQYSTKWLLQITGSHTHVY